jgi:integrase
VLTDDLKQILAEVPDTPLGKRDRALLLLGFAGAFRRSELVALDVADLEDNREGLIVRIRKSKTDQEGEGRAVGIPRGADPPTCPVETLAFGARRRRSRAGRCFGE